MSPRIEVRGLSKRHEGRRVLHQVSFRIGAGEVVGLVGPGGHGKSVLMKHLPRLLIPDAGEVLIDGVSLESLDSPGIAEVRSKMGFVFQNYALFDSLSVWDNVAFPLRQAGLAAAEVQPRVARALERVGLTHAAEQRPNELSGGMKKRVGFARATVGDAGILLYDDPSAGLDPVTSSRIFALIHARAAENPSAVSLIISHDIDRMRAVVTRWIVLERGSVLFDGDPAALASALADPQASPLLTAFFAAAGGLP